MKKLLFSLCIIPVLLQAQTSTPNGSFENWNISPFSFPQDYSFNTNREAFYHCGSTFNVIKTTDAFHGTYAVMLKTVQGSAGGDTCVAVIANTPNPGDSFPAWTGGIPYSEQPTGLRGYYKAVISPGDTARIGVIFKKMGMSIASYVMPIYGYHTSYTLFNLAFPPSFTSAPDTVIFFASSSDIFNKTKEPGNMLKLDSISFTGVATQPALMNEDFEQWQNDTLFVPWNWNIGNSIGEGVTRTMDGFWGFAAELTTYADNSSSSLKAKAGDLVSGLWNVNCSCWNGGNPFSNQADTLLFNYKYAPMGNDSASVKLFFREGGSVIYTAGVNIGPASTYQQAMVPFNIGQVPDTVVVQFKSSLWQDSAASFIGSTLKIDNIHFASQPLSSVPEVIYFQ